MKPWRVHLVRICPRLLSYLIFLSGRKSCPPDPQPNWTAFLVYTALITPLPYFFIEVLAQPLRNGLLSEDPFIKLEPLSFKSFDRRVAHDA